MVDNNTKTQMAMDRIYFEAPDSWEEDLFNSTNYAMELDKRNPVLEGICNRLNLEPENRKDIIKELNSRYKQMGIEDGVPKSVKNWVDGTPVNPAYRANLYNLCMALGLNLEETRIFFLKNYMTVPFNFKDRIDAVYYYGIGHNLNYISIKELLEEVEIENEYLGKANDKTAFIGGYISDIEDLDVLKKYLKQHTYNKKAQYNSAVEVINGLIQENAKLAEIEIEIKPELNKFSIDNDELTTDKKNAHFKNSNRIDSINVAGLLSIIYGYNNQERYSSNKTKISKCDKLPKAFRENFPNDVEISRVVHKDASPDVYRKAIIIMKFYNYYCDGLVKFIYETNSVSKRTKKIRDYDEYWERDPDEIDEDLDDFYYETSSILEKCGFVQMYARNPFDWLMLYCAKSYDPLETLRELLQERYINVDEE